MFSTIKHRDVKQREDTFAVKITVLWNVMPCSLVDILNTNGRGMCCSHHRNYART